MRSTRELVPCRGRGFFQLFEEHESICQSIGIQLQIVIWPMNESERKKEGECQKCNAVKRTFVRGACCVRCRNLFTVGCGLSIGNFVLFFNAEIINQELKPINTLAIN